MTQIRLSPVKSFYDFPQFILALSENTVDELHSSSFYTPSFPHVCTVTLSLLQNAHILTDVTHFCGARDV